jgi:hypothetical protein
MYDYAEAVKDDILEYIHDELDLKAFKDLSELKNNLQDELWNNNSITGNASCSYTFNSEQAKEYVYDNTALLLDAIKEFDVDGKTVGEKFIQKNWEYFDAIIRCYVLTSCINDALEEIKDEFKKAHKN